MAQAVMPPDVARMRSTLETLASIGPDEDVSECKAETIEEARELGALDARWQVRQLARHGLGLPPLERGTVQPDPLRAAAWLALRSAVDTLAYFEENEPYSHGRRDLGHAWSAASESAQALREALGLNRRFTVEPEGNGPKWRVMDRGHVLAATHGAQCVASGYGAAEAFALAAWCDSIDAPPVGLPPARRMLCNCCGGVTLGRQWPNRDTGYALCGKCGDWFKERREPAGETARNNGVRGIHWDVRA